MCAEEFARPLGCFIWYLLRCVNIPLVLVSLFPAALLHAVCAAVSKSVSPLLTGVFFFFSLALCCQSGTVSISITFFNKAVLSIYQFRQPNLMTLAQIIFSLIFLAVMKQTRTITYADFEWSRARKVLPLAISFVGMVLTGLSALNYLNVPMFRYLLLVPVGIIRF